VNVTGRLPRCALPWDAAEVRFATAARAPNPDALGSFREKTSIAHCSDGAISQSQPTTANEQDAHPAVAEAAEASPPAVAVRATLRSLARRSRDPSFPSRATHRRRSRRGARRAFSHGGGSSRRAAAGGRLARRARALPATPHPRESDVLPFPPPPPDPNTHSLPTIQAAVAAEAEAEAAAAAAAVVAAEVAAAVAAAEEAVAAA